MPTKDGFTRRTVGHGRYASVTATLALVVALGGTSYAAVALPSNSVGSKQIKRNGVASSDIRANAVTSAKIKDGSLLKADFLASQLPAGAKGATGAPGAKGDKGDTGAPGPSDAYHAFANSILTSPAATTAFFDVLTLPAVPAGAYLISASVSVENDNAVEQEVTCKLTAGTQSNDALIGVGTNAALNDFGSGSMQIATTFAAPTGATLSCNNPGGAVSDTDVYQRRITAIHVGSLTNGEPQ
jgi:hypothetical protein